MLMKQSNIFCQAAEWLYRHISQLYLNCEIVDEMHRKMLPFLEYHEEEIDVECYECESLLYFNQSLSDAYRVCLENVEEFLKNKEIKNMLKDEVTKDDKKQIKKNSNEQYNLLCEKLNSKEYRNGEINFDFDESVMSEISVKDEVDWSHFVNYDVEPKRNSIFEDSIKFERFVENDGIKNLKEKVVVLRRVQKLSKSSLCYEKTGKKLIPLTWLLLWRLIMLSLAIIIFGMN